MEIELTSPLGISIVIPAYNTGEFVYQAVQSITRQGIQIAHEVILVDDGSNDGLTPTYIEKCAIDFKVQAIRLPKNEGSAHARNIGIQAAKYPYIFNMDADDMLSVNLTILKNGTFCDIGVKHLENHPETAFVHCYTMMFGEYNGYTSSCFPLNEALAIKKYHVPAWIIYRKSDALNAGLYSEEVIKWTDWSFGIALLNGRLKNNLGNTISCLPLPYYQYRIYTSAHRISLKNVSELKMVQKTLDLYPEIFEKYYPDTQLNNRAEKILSQKPSNIQNLLHIANNDIHIAEQFITQRNYKLVSDIESNKTP